MSDELSGTVRDWPDDSRGSGASRAYAAIMRERRERAEARGEDFVPLKAARLGRQTKDEREGRVKRGDS
jgi:hypothetical protein